MPLEALQSISEELRRWVAVIQDWAGSGDQKESEALSSLLDALNETMIYLGRIENDPDTVSREHEEGLSRLWREASQKVRPYNQELAQRCIAKGLYWGNPTYFTDQQIQIMKISITDMQELTNDALKSV